MKIYFDHILPHPKSLQILHMYLQIHPTISSFSKNKGNSNNNNNPHPRKQNKTPQNKQTKPEQTAAK